MITIYNKNKIIFLTDEVEDFYPKFKDREQLKALVFRFLESEHEKLYISAPDLNILFQNFKSIFVYELAAGGLVVNKLKQVLVIKNRGIWQLPKGHVENDELFSDAAIREVVEECNIVPPTIINDLPSTFHLFYKDEKWRLKRTYWFKMVSQGNEKPKPQLEEGITEAVWIDKKDIHLVIENTYKNLMQIWQYI